MIKTGWGIVLAGVVLLSVIGVVGSRAVGGASVRLERVVFPEPERMPAWVQRIALVDEALGRADLSRAVYEWREAYGAAVRTKGCEGLIAVADRAIQLDKISHGSAYFRSEATYVYVQAALRARAQHSTQTILEISDKFQDLGDTQRATQLRRLAGNPS